MCKCRFWALESDDVGHWDEIRPCCSSAGLHAWSAHADVQCTTHADGMLQTGKEVRYIKASCEQWLSVLVSTSLACSTRDAEAIAARVKDTPILQYNGLGIDEKRLELFAKQQEGWMQKVNAHISIAASQTTD